MIIHHHFHHHHYRLNHHYHHDRDGHDGHDIRKRKKRETVIIYGLPIISIFGMWHLPNILGGWNLPNMNMIQQISTSNFVKAEMSTKTTITNGVLLTHWGRVTHICVSKLTIIGSDNGLSPDRRQAIIWTSGEILLIRPLGTSFSEIVIGIYTFSFKKKLLKVSSAKWRPFCLGLNELTQHWDGDWGGHWLIFDVIPGWSKGGRKL